MNQPSAKIELNKSLIFLLAVGAGVSVSALYYAQPMLSVIRDDLKVSIEMVGFIPSMTQIGYALGLFFLAPLGDRYNRKKIINIKLFFLLTALVMSFFATNIWWIVLSRLMTGMFIGMSVGASLGSIFFARFGLYGFAFLTTFSTLLVVLIKMRNRA